MYYGTVPYEWSYALGLLAVNDETQSNCLVLQKAGSPQYGRA